MNKFEFNDTQEQKDSVFIYSFHPDLLSASEKDLTEHLKLLGKYIPTQSTPWSEESRAVNIESLGHKQWLKCYENVSRLIKERQESSRHWRLFFLSLISTLVLVGTLLYRVIVIEEKIAEIHEKQINTLIKFNELSLKLEKTHNKVLNSPSAGTAKDAAR